MILLLFITVCSGSFVVYSPDEVITTIDTFDIGQLSYGNPSFYSTIGKLTFVTISSSCTVNEMLDDYSFAVIDMADADKCGFAVLSLSVQNQKGAAAVFILDSDDTQYVFIDLDSEVTIKVEILSIVISKSLGNSLKKYSDKEIWVSYQFEVQTSSSPKLVYYLLGNYTADDIFFSSLQNLNNKDTIPMSMFELGLFPISSDTPGISTDDCIGDYCMFSSEGVSGSQKIVNTAIMLNFYQDLSTVAEIINFFREVYSKCETDYSQACVENVVIQYGGTPDASVTSFPVSYYPSSYEYYIFTIDYFEFYWPKSIDIAYCLSQTSPSSNCPKCIEQCLYEDLRDTTCSVRCNSSSCGYDNMYCLESQSCYTFMLADGNCNDLCSDDPDCSTSKSVHLAAIIVPIIGGVIIIVVIVIIVIYYKKRKNMDPQFPKFDAKAFVNKSNPRDEKINPVIPIIPIMNQEVYQQIYTRELGVDRPKICHLDLRGFNEGENVAIFPSCNHIIHLSCIEVWNKTNPGRCPSCYMIERDNKIQEDQNRIDPNLAYPIIVGPRV